MAVEIKGQMYYRTIEDCKVTGISRNTFPRWAGEALYGDVEIRDRNFRGCSVRMM